MKLKVIVALTLLTGCRSNPPSEATLRELTGTDAKIAITSEQDEIRFKMLASTGGTVARILKLSPDSENSSGAIEKLSSSATTALPVNGLRYKIILALSNAQVCESVGAIELSGEAAFKCRVPTTIESVVTYFHQSSDLKQVEDTKDYCKIERYGDIYSTPYKLPARGWTACGKTSSGAYVPMSLMQDDGRKLASASYFEFALGSKRFGGVLFEMAGALDSRVLVHCLISDATVQCNTKPFELPKLRVFPLTDVISSESEWPLFRVEGREKSLSLIAKDADKSVNIVLPIQGD